jgi:hypothetical protein
MIELEDDFGRIVRFTGEELLTDSTDYPDGSKPRFTRMTIWRTARGQYVLLRETCYRIRHTTDRCPRALRDNTELVNADETDTFLCETCGEEVHPGPDWGQADRAQIEVFPTPTKLIESFRTIHHQTGKEHYSRFAQALLARLSELDPAVAAQWMEVTVA